MQPSIDFVLTVKHDYGKFRKIVSSSDEQGAKQRIMNTENCPECAIVNVEPYKKKEKKKKKKKPL